MWPEASESHVDVPAVSAGMQLQRPDVGEWPVPFPHPTEERGHLELNEVSIPFTALLRIGEGPQSVEPVPLAVASNLRPSAAQGPIASRFLLPTLSRLAPGLGIGPQRRPLPSLRPPLPDNELASLRIELAFPGG